MDHVSELKKIGQAIGFGNSTDILCKAWDEMLLAKYGIKPYHGQNWMASKRNAVKSQECLIARIDSLRKDADFNFELYQDAGAELFKVAEQCEELLAALEKYLTVSSQCGGGDKQLFMAAIREADDGARAAIANVKNDAAVVRKSQTTEPGPDCDGGSRAGHECPICNQNDCNGCQEGRAK